MRLLICLSLLLTLSSCDFRKPQTEEKDTKPYNDPTSGNGAVQIEIPENKAPLPEPSDSTFRGIWKTVYMPDLPSVLGLEFPLAEWLDEDIIARYLDPQLRNESICLTNRFVLKNNLFALAYFCQIGGENFFSMRTFDSQGRGIDRLRLCTLKGSETIMDALWSGDQRVTRIRGKKLDEKGQQIEGYDYYQIDETGHFQPIDPGPPIQIVGFYEAEVENKVEFGQPLKTKYQVQLWESNGQLKPWISILGSGVNFSFSYLEGSKSKWDRSTGQIEFITKEGILFPDRKLTGILKDQTLTADFFNAKDFSVTFHNLELKACCQDNKLHRDFNNEEEWLIHVTWLND